MTKPSCSVSDKTIRVQMKKRIPDDNITAGDCFLTVFDLHRRTGSRTLFQYFSINNTIACSPVAG